MPLWFCLALNPLSNFLNKSNLGFKINKPDEEECKINHLIDMDDIKLYSSSAPHMKQFSDDICMSFGLGKCKTQSILREPLDVTGFELDDGTLIQPMNEDQTYKSLGF
jgi:hypothetical protein